MRARTVISLAAALVTAAACSDLPDRSLITAPSVASAVGDPLPASAAACVERTRDAVIALAGTGAINAGQRNALESKLDAIVSHITNGRATPAWNVLNAYNNAVDALEQSGRITAAQAEAIRLSFECATPVAIAAGDQHTCVLLADGSVWCWGLNNVGQLGNGTTTSSALPVLVSGPPATRLDASGPNACILDSGGLPHCWGQNNVGQLGNGTTVSSSTPTPVSWAAGSIAQLTVGHSMACGRLASGQTYCWGANGEGQLGTGASTDTCLTQPCSLTPIPITTHTFTTVDAGILGACGIDASGAAFCWGERGFGAIGDGTTVGNCVVNGATRFGCVAAPTAVSGGHLFRSIQFGAQYACGVRTDGVSMCWGNNTTGQVGNGVAGPIVTTPQTVLGGLTFLSLASDDENSVLAHTCALDAVGSASCWGWNGQGQLGAVSSNTCSFGLTNHACSTTPIAVGGGHAFKQLALGRLHSCGLTTGNEVLCWGGNNSGQLGDGTTTDHMTPAPVATPWLPPPSPPAP